MDARRYVRWIVSVLVLCSAVSIAAQPAQSQTPSEFYLAYRGVFDKATTVDEIVAYQSARVRKQIAGSSKAERDKNFELMKIMGTLTNVKVVKETAAPDSATLAVEGLDADRKKSTGKVTLVKEGGSWKIDTEDWSS
jgi:hypothetical protein